jgi:hypothetical protein
MTLIAAYKHYEVPVLVGDMAITRNGDRKFRSLRKKIYRISPNFVIGWTGYEIIAKKIISSLWKTFKDKTVKKESLEDYLINFEAKDFGSLYTKFIGWIIDYEPHCFLWNCLYPKQIFYNQSYIDGSGKGYFENLKQQSWQHGNSNLLPQIDKIILSILSDISKMRFEESLYKKTWDISFGAAYDILLFINGSFKFIPSIIYIGWDYHWNSSKETGVLEQAPIIMKYNYMGDFSILQEALFGKYYDGRTINYLSRPLYDEMKIADLSNYPLSLQSYYYVNYFRFMENGKKIFITILAIQNITNEGPMKIDYNSIPPVIMFDNKELDKIYLKHRENIS